MLKKNLIIKIKYEDSTIHTIFSSLNIKALNKINLILTSDIYLSYFYYKIDVLFFSNIII